MRNIIAALALACMAVFIDATLHPAQAQIGDIDSAINKAGRQRMLSQRMAKAYLQIGQDIDSERSAKILDGSIALFDRQLVELKNFAPTPEIRNTYLSLERAWLAYKDALIGAKPGTEGAKRVMEISEEVLSLAHQGTVQLEKHSGTAQGRLVNKAGRQRMLSQRMAKFYQAIRWGIAPANAQAELDKARKEFVAGLQELSGAKINTPAIREELEEGRKQWALYDAALQRRGDKTHATGIAGASENLLEVMNTVTGMYEKLQSRN